MLCGPSRGHVKSNPGAVYHVMSSDDRARTFPPAITISFAADFPRIQPALRRNVQADSRSGRIHLFDGWTLKGAVS